jgi:predicted RNA-binding Zn-ribbon protein involved in translation (DUF1610 family)
MCTHDWVSLPATVLCAVTKLDIAWEEHMHLRYCPKCGAVQRVKYFEEEGYYWEDLVSPKSTGEETDEV